MGRANIRSGDEPIKYLMANGMTINLDMLDTFMKSRIVGKKDCCLVITIHEHGTLYWITNLQKKRIYPKHLKRSMHHSTVFSFNIAERDNVLFFTPPRDKVPANECAVPKNTFSITMIACIGRVKSRPPREADRAVGREDHIQDRQELEE